MAFPGSLPWPRSIDEIDPEFINPEWPICAGYLDKTLAIFERHNHPFILVSTLAMRWSGARALPQAEFDVLVRTSQQQAIVKGLLASGDWELSEYYNKDSSNEDSSMINHTLIPDTWLKPRHADPMFHYLRLWPEELYKLSIECTKIEVPDVLNKQAILLEEEYYRDPVERFGPPRFSTRRPEAALPVLQFRAKILRLDIPIFIPTIECHLNALVDQARAEIVTGLSNGAAPVTQIQYFIRYLFLDWPPARDWILDTKVREDNQELMRQWIDRFRRKMILRWDPDTKKSSTCMPWELPPRKQVQGSEENLQLTQKQAAGQQRRA